MHRADGLTLAEALERCDIVRPGVNEAAELLTTRLEGRIAVDFETARRLFTLICALHWRG